MSHLTARQVGEIMWHSDEVEVHDTVLAMTVVRAASWHVEGYSSERGEWATVYKGPDIRAAIFAVQNHDDTRVNYLYGTWREIT